MYDLGGNDALGGKLGDDRIFGVAGFDQSGDTDGGKLCFDNNGAAAGGSILRPSCPILGRSFTPPRSGRSPSTWTADTSRR